jgi:hypothetical protein
VNARKLLDLIYSAGLTPQKIYIFMKLPTVRYFPRKEEISETELKK